MHRASLLLSFAAASLAATPAVAQQATALDRFDPAPAGDGFFGVPEAHVDGRLRGSARALFSYAEGLLLVPEQPGVVQRQLALHALFSLQIWKRVLVEIDVPSVLFQEGTSAQGASLLAPASGAALGDIRFGARVAALEGKGWIPGIGLSLAVHTPTGDANSYVGTGSARFAGSVQVGTRTPRFSWGTSFGGRYEDGEQNLWGGMLFAQGGAAVTLGPVRLGPEVLFTYALRPSRNLTQAGLELLLGARGDVGPIELGLGAGVGVTDAVGTPLPRVLATVAAHGDLLPARRHAPFGPHAGDADAARAPRREPPGQEAKAGPAPPPAPVADASADRDGDGVRDVDDACPDAKGSPSLDPKRNGCVPDRDGDGVADDRDACPADAGRPSDDPKRSGCPELVRVGAGAIDIFQQVTFEEGKDVLRAESLELLRQIGRLLADHPEIARVAVDGHTDDVGAAKDNLELSRKRAVAVSRWLTEQALVDARRLEARGFGARQPLVKNDTPENRAKNRRVEFVILKKAADGEAGWVEGHVER